MVGFIPTTQSPFSARQNILGVIEKASFNQPMMKNIPNS
jgi:hypothetical protein